MSIAKSEMVFEAETRVPGDDEKKLTAKQKFQGQGLKVVADDATVSNTNEGVVLWQILFQRCHFFFFFFL